MSTIQFNLLPDLKIHYIKSERTRNLVVSIAVLVTGAAIFAFLIMMFTVNVVQKKQLSNADKQVTEASKELEGIEKLDYVLTVQNQLETLSSLHNDKHISSRIFSYLPQVTPTSVKIGGVNADFEESTMTIDGTADSHSSVNIFIDTLKFTTFKVSEDSPEAKAFPKVVENSFSINPGNITYSLSVEFDPQLFSNSVRPAPKLTVPKLTTTRSALNDSSNVLFNGQTGGQTKPGGR